MRISSISSEYEKLYHLLERPVPLAAQRAKKAAEGIEKDLIQISAVDGWLLSFLFRLGGCKKIVEVGTLTGYSTAFILEQLPRDGKLWSLELSAEHARLAEAALSAEGLNRDGRLKILVGDARENLKALAAEGPFDGIFIDANKAATFDYVLWSEANISPGGLLVLDNVLLHGEFFGPSERFSKNQREALQNSILHLEKSPAWELVMVPASDAFAVARRI